MDIESRLSLSFYQEVATISKAHQVYVVQHRQTLKIYIKKVLTVYNRAVYDHLRKNPIPHTPRIYEVYEENGTLTIIEEYISGSTLEQMMEEGEIFSETLVRDVVSRVCTIVSELHSRQPAIIHRDIKPSNIIVTASGEVYLLDFNAAKYYSDERNEDTVLLGTKGYAAPEQYGFGVSTTQTDIYGIGMLLKELIHSRGYTGDPSDHEFDGIISKCTRLNAGERYKDAAAILRILNRGNQDQAVTSPVRPGWRGYLPPGFQSFSPLTMTLAGSGYIFIIWLCLTMDIEGVVSHTSVLVERVMTLMMCLSIAFCSANYRNVQSHFPPCRTQNPLLRVLAVILLDALLLLAFMVVMIILVGFIG